MQTKLQGLYSLYMKPRNEKREEGDPVDFTTKSLRGLDFWGDLRLEFMQYPPIFG